jgi:hypothetical protein
MMEPKTILDRTDVRNIIDEIWERRCSGYSSLL